MAPEIIVYLESQGFDFDHKPTPTRTGDKHFDEKVQELVSATSHISILLTSCVISDHWFPYNISGNVRLSIASHTMAMRMFPSLTQTEKTWVYGSVDNVSCMKKEPLTKISTLSLRRKASYLNLA